MHFKKQTDGLNWLLYDDSGETRRKLAMVRIAPENVPVTFEVERLQATDDEMSAVEETAQKILRRYIDDKLPILVVCMHPRAGMYVQSLVNALGLQELILVKDGSTSSLAETFESLSKETYWQEVCGKRTFKEAWIVGDKENGPMRIVDAAVQEQFPTIHTALTQPAFEYWLLLHDPAFDGRVPIERETVVNVKQSEEYLGNGHFKKVVVTEVIQETSAVACRALFAQRMPTLVRAVSFKGLMPTVETAYRRVTQTEAGCSSCTSQMPQFLERLRKLLKQRPDAVFQKLGAEKLELPPVPEKPKSSSKVVSDTLPAELKEALPFLIECGHKANQNAVLPTTEKAVQTMCQHLDAMKVWAEKEHKRLFKKAVAIPPAFLVEPPAISTSTPKDFSAFAVKHFWLLRCRLGTIAKDKFDPTQGNFCRLLAELKMCREWCDCFLAAAKKNKEKAA